jgi:hypothetical protein
MDPDAQLTNGAMVVERDPSMQRLLHQQECRFFTHDRGRKTGTAPLLWGHSVRT